MKSSLKPALAAPHTHCVPHVQLRRARTHAAASAASLSTQAEPSTAWSSLQGVEVFRASDGQKVKLASMWGPNDRTVVALARSFGCFFCWELATQLNRDVKPQLDAQGIKLFLVSVGTPARALDFAAETGFPPENLLADPENVSYDALGLVRDFRATFLDYNTPLAFKKRMDEGRMGDLQNILPRWKPWNPPRMDQALQQGGMFIFQGDQLLFDHRDVSTGAHADLQLVLSKAMDNLTAADCGCDASRTAAA